MKLRKIAATGLSLVLVGSLLAGCGKKEPESIDDLIIETSDIEVSTPTPTPKKEITHEDSEAYKLFEEDISSLNEYKYFYANRSSYLISSVSQYSEDEITLEYLIDTYTKARNLSKCEILSYSFEEPEEKVVYNNGVGKAYYDEEFIAYLDLDDTIQNYIDSQATPLGEWYELYSFVDTLCSYIGCQGIVLTTNGAPFHVMYHTFTDEPIYFSTKIADYLDYLDSSEIEFSKILETYIDLGYNITRENYKNFLSSGGDESLLKGLESIPAEETEVIDNTEEVIEDNEDNEDNEDSEETETEESESSDETETVIIGG